MGALIVPNGATHAAVVTIAFADDGEDEQSVVGFGSREQCEGIASTLPAVSYEGPRRVRDASASVFRLHPFCDVCGQRHEGARACQVSK
jgi:hypothetical protein